MKKMMDERKKAGLLTNPYGETKSEFIEKYNGMENIAEICWYFGVRLEKLRDELKILLEDGGNEMNK